MSSDGWFVILIGLIVGGCVVNSYSKRPQVIEVEGRICIVADDASIECRKVGKP